MQPIDLKVSIDETNLILEALGQMPYVQVHQLIAKIHQQASAQLQGREENQQLQKSVNETVSQESN